MSKRVMADSTPGLSGWRRPFVVQSPPVRVRRGPRQPLVERFEQEAGAPGDAQLAGVHCHHQTAGIGR